MTKNEPFSSPDNIISFSRGTDDLGSIWLIGSLNVELGHSVTMCLTIKFSDENRDDVDMALMLFEVSRFDASDFTHEAEGLEMLNDIERVLPKISGIYEAKKSSLLTETKAKYGLEYPDGKKVDLRHFIVSTDQEVINIIANNAPTLIFNNKTIEAELTKTKET